MWAGVIKHRHGLCLRRWQRCARLVCQETGPETFSLSKCILTCRGIGCIARLAFREKTNSSAHGGAKPCRSHLRLLQSQPGLPPGSRTRRRPVDTPALLCSPMAHFNDYRFSKYSGSPLPLEDMLQDAQWRPEPTGSTEPCRPLRFLLQ